MWHLHLPRDPDGLSIAVARCDYLAGKRPDTHL